MSSEKEVREGGRVRPKREKESRTGGDGRNKVTLFCMFIYVNINVFNF